MYKDKNIQKLVDELDIVQVIGEYVVLKKAGANYKGLSPFKEEKTPSFVVSPRKKIYKDFSTGDGGDVIKFYRKINNLSFYEAVNELARKYNISIKTFYEDSSRITENEKYYEIMKQAQIYFSKNIFNSSEALNYMGNRGYLEVDLRKFGIGFSENKWDGLLSYLTNKGYSIDDLLELGLVIKNENGNIFDYFRNRIIFPIYNDNMKIVGFGGRTINTDENTPKYLNSPESKIFKKGKELFGLLNRGEQIRKRGVAILMEGYLDVLTAHKNGFEFAVASLGTAFTIEQAEYLKRYATNVIIAYDNDSAGKNATVKAANILKKYDFNIRCLTIDGEVKDPDEYLKKYGKKAFLKLLKTTTVEVFEYIYEEYSKDLDLKSIVGKERFINRIKDFMLNVKSEVEKSIYIQKISVELEIDKEVLYSTFSTRKFSNNNWQKKIINSMDPKYTKIVLTKKTKKEKDILLIEETLKYLIQYADLEDENIIKHRDILSSMKIENEEYKNFFLKLKMINFKVDKKENINELNLTENEKNLIFDCFLSKQNMKEERDNVEANQYKALFVGWFKKEIEQKRLEINNENRYKLSIKLKSIESDLKVMNKIEDIEKLYFDFISEESKNV